MLQMLPTQKTPRAVRSSSSSARDGNRQLVRHHHHRRLCAPPFSYHSVSSHAAAIMATTILLGGAGIGPSHEVLAYYVPSPLSSSIGIRHHNGGRGNNYCRPCGNKETTVTSHNRIYRRPWQSSSSSGSSSSSSPWVDPSRVGCHGSRNIHLYGANAAADDFSSATTLDDRINTDNVRETTDTNTSAIDEDDDETVLFDNLIPSASSIPISNSRRTVGGRTFMTGPSSSSQMLLPPLSKAASDMQNNVPLPPFRTREERPSSISSAHGVIAQPTTRTAKEEATTTTTTTWKERLVDVSNLASLLCVLDCTLLPLISVAIPAISWGVELVSSSATTNGGAVGAGNNDNNAIMTSLSSSMGHYLPVLSHGIALYFVVPVGLFTAIVNYLLGHRDVRFALVSLAGVALIFAANSSDGVGVPSADAWLRSAGIVATAHATGGGHAVHHHHAIVDHVRDACGAVAGAAANTMAHTTCPSTSSEGSSSLLLFPPPAALAHRITNTLGCALLLGSNYASRRYAEERGGGGCAAGALAEALGGDTVGRAMASCPPGCGCGAMAYGTGSGGGGARAMGGGETFFQWKRTNGDGS